MLARASVRSKLTNVSVSEKEKDFNEVEDPVSVVVQMRKRSE